MFGWTMDDELLSRSSKKTPGDNRFLVAVHTALELLVSM